MLLLFVCHVFCLSDTLTTQQKVRGITHGTLPIIKELANSESFRYFKTNLHKKCPFWESSHLCTLTDCSVEQMEIDQVPEQYRKQVLSKVDFSVGPFKKVCTYTESDFCLVDEAFDGQFVDLVGNPERYTGYAGESAARVWRAIYEENCFHPSPDLWDGLEQCIEERAFYKLISGLHTSISTHICAEYLNRQTGEWGPNHACYWERVGKHPERIENLYFLWAVATRAIQKTSGYLLSTQVCANGKDQGLLKNLVDNLSEPTFDETILFQQNPHLKTSFRDTFRNITNIMDCVECEKCRLWGKLQTMGLATALKILYTDAVLTNTEVVALVNVYHRITSSVEYGQMFEQQVRNTVTIDVSNPSMLWLGATIIVLGIMRLVRKGIQSKQKLE